MSFPAQFKVAEAMDEAFERIQLDPKGLTAEHVVSARRSIRLLLDSWNNDSIQFWKMAAGQQQAMTQGLVTFTPVAGTIDILQCSILRNGAYIPVDLISETDWFAIPDRDATPQVQGLPRMAWVQRLITGPVVHLYPAADLATDFFVYDAMLQFNDSAQLNGGADVPFRWNNAFTSGLCASLAEKYAPALYAAKQAKYGGPGYLAPRGAPPTDYQLARMGDRERTDTIFVFQKSRRTRR